MTLTLEKVHRHGDWRFSVICERFARANVLGGGVFASGAKWPVAVVFHDGKSLSAMDMQGRPMDLAELEQCCPGLASAFGQPVGDAEPPAS